MQYVGRAIGTVSRTWNSLNPSTLSGAIDVVVVRQDNGDLQCSAFHIRFGKLSLLRPSQKGVDFYVNGQKVDVQMKLGEGGEAFFVFETQATVPESLLTSPVISPSGSPAGSPDGSVATRRSDQSDDEVDFLDISRPGSDGAEGSKDSNSSSDTNTPSDSIATKDEDDLEPHLREQDPQRIDEIIRRLSEVNIPSMANDNGEVIVDMTGYKPGGQNTRELEEVVQDILAHDSQPPHTMDYTTPPGSPPGASSYSPPRSPGSPKSPSLVPVSASDDDDDDARSTNSSASGSSQSKAWSGKHYVKTLRLSSEVLRSLNLKLGANDMKFVVRSNGATVTAQMFLWDVNAPVVISDIDGTITRSDALGHVMTMIGRDWTHAGVSKLFTDIAQNGYNIMYLTSRSAGLADATRNYLRSIEQDGYRMPSGPVILSPDRTMAALRREVIMRKPEIFKMACLRDISKLYHLGEGVLPFFAGFGNRITDGLSYRSVGVPSTKIFTINTDSEVRMELLELTGYKSTYILISDLVDHFFPPVTDHMRPGVIEYTDANFWREPMPELSDDSDSETAANAIGTSGTAPRTVDTSTLDYEGHVMPRFEAGSEDGSGAEGSDDYTESDFDSEDSDGASP